MWLMMLFHSANSLQVWFRLHFRRQPIAIITDLGPLPDLLLKTLQGNTFIRPHFLAHKPCYLAFCTHCSRPFITTANCRTLPKEPTLLGQQVPCCPNSAKLCNYDANRAGSCSMCLMARYGLLHVPLPNYLRIYPPNALKTELRWNG